MTSEQKLSGGLSPSSITRVGTHEPFELQVARGQIFGHKSTVIFGFNPDINGTEEVIWDAGGLYTYPSDGITMYVSSSSTTDDAASTGAREVTIIGLDADYNEITDTVSLDGQNQVATNKQFRRIFRMFVSAAGSGGTAVGTIYLATSGESAGVPTGTVYAQIIIGQNSTLMGMWTVPAGYTAYFLQGSLALGTANGNQYLVARQVIRPEGGVFQTIAKTTLNNGINTFDFHVPIPIPEKTDIQTRAYSSGTNNFVTSEMAFIYIKNDTLS